MQKIFLNWQGRARWVFPIAWVNGAMQESAVISSVLWEGPLFCAQKERRGQYS